MRCTISFHQVNKLQLGGNEEQAKKSNHDSCLTDLSTVTLDYMKDFLESMRLFLVEGVFLFLFAMAKRHITIQEEH